MFEEEFSSRLMELRTHKGVSARDMSLSIGQNPGYIRDIEAGKNMPSMSSFFFICDYLGISPKDFFETDLAYPERLRGLVEDIKLLNEDELEHLSAIVRSIVLGRKNT